MSATPPSTAEAGPVETEPLAPVKGNQNRQRLYHEIKRLSGQQSEAEIVAHFVGMPRQYWEGLTVEDLTHHLSCVHQYLKSPRGADPSFPFGRPVLTWEDHGDGSTVRSTICVGDHRGLLAKLAAAFSALRLNILQAEAYTRNDGVVLDTFLVQKPSLRHSESATDWKHHLGFLVEGMVSEPPRFASVWACQAHKAVSSGRRANPVVQLESPEALDYTVLSVEAWDHLGILCDMLQALSDPGLSVMQAHVKTDENRVRNTFYVTDKHGAKIANRCTLEAIRCRVIQALG